MDVTVDNVPRLMPEAPDMLTLVADLNAALRTEGRALVGLSIDGEAVSPEALGERFAGVSAAGRRVEASSRPIAELVLESLDEIAATLPELPSACRKLAEVFQSENPNDGFEPFEELATIWDHLKARQRMAAEALGIALETIEIKGQPVSAHLAEFNAFLDEAAQALRDGDTVLLGDLLEYELAPRAELESDIVAELRRRAEAAAR